MITFALKTKPKGQKENAQDWPKEYSCNFLEAGVVSYTDVGQGVAYLTKETIQKMCGSFIGKPVLIDHYDVTPKTFDRKAVGYVTSVWFNEADGWFWCKFLVTDDKAKELISKGYSVSCAFDVLATGAGGEWHNIKYDEELTDCSFTHLALVASPRYEQCKIYMNSKGLGVMNDEQQVVEEQIEEDKAVIRKKKGNAPAPQEPWEVECSDDTFEIIQTDRLQNQKACPSCGSKDTTKVSGPEAFKCIDCGHKFNNKKENIIMFGKKKDKKEETKLNASNAFVVVDGERVSIKTLVNAKAESERSEVEVGIDETIVIAGTELSVSELVESYRENKKKKKDKKKDVKQDTPQDMVENGGDDDDKENDDEDKENDDEDDDKENTSMAAKQEIKKTKADAKKKMKDKKKEDGDSDEEEAEDDKKEHGKDEDKEETLEKKNDKKKHFTVLENARENGDSEEEDDDYAPTMAGRVERGNSRYGSKTK